MKLEKKKEQVEIDVVEIFIDGREDYNEYLQEIGDPGSVLELIDDKFNDLGCSGNHNSWSGYANMDKAEFNMISDYNGRQSILRVIISPELYHTTQKIQSEM